MITLLSALTVLVPGPLATSGGGEAAATALATTTLATAADRSAEWLELDRELVSLTAPSWDGHDEGDLRFIFDGIFSQQVAEDGFFTSGGEDISGTALRRLRLAATGEVADFEYFVSTELSGGTAQLFDAMISWNLGGVVKATVGRYRSPLFWSSQIWFYDDPFIDPEVTAFESSDRTPGAMVSGEFGDFGWLLSVQNGVDGTSEDQQIVGRIQWDVIGDTAFGANHGAVGYGDELHLSVAGGFIDDGSIDNGSAGAGEFGLVVGGFSARGSFLTYDENYDETTGLDLDATLGTTKANTSPAALTFGYLMGAEDDWEILARLEDFDDEFETERSSIGLFRYLGMGHNLRWGLAYQEYSSDSLALEGSRLELSLSLRTE